MDFLKDVGQRAGDGCSVRDGETDAIILPGSGVRVLPEYDNLYLVKRTDIKNVKDTEPGGSTWAWAYSFRTKAVSLSK